MKYLFILMLAAISFSVCAQSNWKSYHQHVYNIELPDYFLPVASQDPSVDMFTNSNNRDILLRVENQPSDQVNFNNKYLGEIGNRGLVIN